MRGAEIPLAPIALVINMVPENSYLRVSSIPKRVGVSKSTWWRWVAEGKAPQPRRLSRGVTVWKESEVMGFVEKQGRES